MKKCDIHIIYFALLMLLNACSSKITSEYTEMHTEIYAGESAMIYWNFKNADSVLIDKIDGVFARKGSFEVSPTKTTVYNLNAFNKAGNKKTLTWIVNVIGLPQAGPKLSLGEIGTSNKSSEYIAGVAESVELDRIKIVGGTYPHENNSFSLKFLPFDKHGNYINNMDIQSNLMSIFTKELSEACTITGYKEKNIYQVKNNFCFAIDNSAAATENYWIFEQIKRLSELYPLSDNFFISYFNQNFGDFFPIEKDENNHFKQFYNIPDPSGFNSINKSVGQTINLMKDFSEKNIIILITQSADNASVLYDEKDLILHAQKNNIPIHAVAVGSTFPTYNLAYLASKTGGRLYVLEAENINLLPALLHEIIFSQHFHYNVDFIPPISINQRELNVELSVKGAENSDAKKDSYIFPLRQEKIFSEFQILASFNDADTSVSESYLLSIRNLAATLIDNPKSVIELAGHSSANEGNAKECNKIALLRSQNIRKKLIEFGANPAQIRLSVEGASRPLYLFPQSKWQDEYNNRIEIRWLLPEELPYEILAEVAVSETDAQATVDKWEQLNYRAYYQRIIQNQRPAYRVLIWGYATESDAQKAIRKLKQKYRKNFVLK